MMHGRNISKKCIHLYWNVWTYYCKGDIAKEQILLQMLMLLLVLLPVLPVYFHCGFYSDTIY